jgi:hypothetical protein
LITAPPLEGPPLATGAQLVEVRLPHSIESNETVVVELDASGAPVRVRVRQRLVLDGSGDYAFGVPAPLLTVARAPGSQSEPGARSGLLLWQGFATGRRVLVADVPLSVAAAAPHLPVRFRVRRASERRELVVENVTGTVATEPSITGRITASEAARALDELRAALARGRPAGDRYVFVEGLQPAPAAHTAVALRVTGTVRVGAGERAFSQVVIPDRAFVLDLPASGRLRVDATAVPVPPTVRPPGGVSWAAAAADGRLEAGPALLMQVLGARLDAARYRQYTQFLANPDRVGAARAVYVFRSAPTERAGHVRSTSTGGGWSVLQIALVVLGAVVGSVGLLVWWAHS